MNTKRINQFIALFIACLPATLWAQFSDNFSDGNFTTNPTWSGVADNFSVNAAGELQLNDADVSHTLSYLTTNVPLKDTATWEFVVRLPFAPSTSNYARIYLASTSADLSGSLNGFFIQIGESNATDALDLRKQTGTSSTSILRGTSGAVATSPNVRVRVTRSHAGQWTLFADYAGGTNFVADGTATDATPLDGSFFGLRCNYTSSNKANFFFDDLKASPLFSDTTPPTLSSAAASSGTQIILTFSEAVGAASAQTLSNYTINNGVTVTGASVSGTTVTLTINPAMTSGQSYTLNVSGVKDLAGNTMSATSKTFTYYNIQTAEAFDILINEIMADPDPVISNLPSAEFVELYNKSSKAIDLGGMGIASGGTPQVLPSYILVPNSYVVVCDDAKLAEFTALGIAAVAVGSFPSLSNTGDIITLTTSDGLVIDEVSFTDAWYQNTDKNDGGWSLELINPKLYCQGGINWTASNDARGATPASQNSVFSNLEDTKAPSLVEALAISQNQILVIFDEIMGASASLSSSYTITGGVGSITSASLQSDRKSVILTIGTPLFADRAQYTITANGVTDCVGNAIGSNKSKTFTYYQTATPEVYNILINEIFIDQSPALGLPSEEFIELYNPTDKAFNLSNVTLTVGTTVKNIPFYILEPNAYVILTDVAAVGNYAPYGATLGIASFPSLPNSEGKISISAGGTTVHSISYTDAWYQDADKDDGGWTLEMINPNSPCEGETNWHASLNLNGGTPGDNNSVFDAETEKTPLKAIRLFSVSSTQLEVNFNQNLDGLSATNTANYSISNNIGVSSVTMNAEGNAVFVNLASPLAQNTIYTLTLQNGLKNCIGDAIVSSTYNFGLASTPEAGDVVINEILFNPVTGGQDFVEIYNKSSKILNLNDLLIANVTDENTRIERMDVDYLILPNSFVVVTEDVKDIAARYQVKNPNWLVEIPDMPTFDDSDGNITIYTGGIGSPVFIDAFNYTDDYHNRLLDDKNGVSLERIDINAATQTASNWHSAAQGVGGATPTYQNSQFFANPTSSETFEVTRKTFSPDGDGNEDFLTMNYKVSQTGFLAKITVFDAHGRMVRQLVKNEVLASEGSFIWDGSTEKSEKARIGIYVILFELFDANGKKEQFKETCVLAGRLN